MIHVAYSVKRNGKRRIFQRQQADEYHFVAREEKADDIQFGQICNRQNKLRNTNFEIGDKY